MMQKAMTDHSTTSPPALAVAPRLLMIDNNQGDLELIRIAFEEAAIRVDLVLAGSGRAGLAALERVVAGIDPPYLLTLLDLNMPGHNGHDVLLWARAQPALATAPIVILSSSGSACDRRSCLAEGATDVLVKPPTFSAVIALVEGLRTYLNPDPARIDGSGAAAILT